ncbi:hypothetical protein AGMMS49992_02570 [Clostridia bacterium]|nr:hypothetical protein AGMMS49992_02570 [Clostridia bacterium]
MVFPFDHTADEATIADFAAAARDAGLVIAEVGAWCNPISPDAAVREAALARCKAQLRLADQIGARCCVNIAGSGGSRWDGAYAGNYSQETWDATVQSIQNIIDDVRPTRTFYTLEPMPWMIPNDPDEYLRLLRAVDRERFAVHMDLCNWITSAKKLFFSGEFAEECFAKLGSYVRSCHLKDVAIGDEFTIRLIESRCGAGLVDLETYGRLASAADPDMPILLEHLPSDEVYIEDLRKVQARFAAVGLISH